jgi:hypothetical protein
MKTDLNSIGERMRTQDNLATSHPLFVVYDKRRIWGMDPQWFDDTSHIGWRTEDSEYSLVVGNPGFEELEKARKSDYSDCVVDKEGVSWYRYAFVDVDRFVTVCFTMEAAKTYIEVNRHNLKVPFVFVESGYRNPEMQAVQSYLKGLPKEE